MLAALITLISQIHGTLAYYPYYHYHRCWPDMWGIWHCNWWGWW